MRLSVGLASAALIALQVYGIGAANREQSGGASRAGADTSQVVCIVREADYVGDTQNAPVAGRSGQSPVALLAVDAQSGVPIYSLTGTRESELVRHVGRRVEITGALEGVRSEAPTSTPQAGDAAARDRTATPSGEAGVTPAGAPAHEPGDAAIRTDTTSATRATSGTRDPVVVVSTLPRVNVRSYRPIDGTCARTPRSSRTPTSRPSPTNAETERKNPASEVSPSTQTITATGCLLAQTKDGGTSSNRRPEAIDALVLTSASIVGAPRNDVKSAVPGSLPSGSGSGTVDRASSKSATPSESRSDQSFLLVIRDRRLLDELTKHVATRVEITGTVADASTLTTPDRAESKPAAAHPSAPSQRLTVARFRGTSVQCGGN